MGRVAEDLQPEIDRLRPSPRRDTWLAFDSTNDAPGKDIHAIGLLKAHTTGVDYLDPATADFPDGADRPPHEPTTRAMADRLDAEGVALFGSDPEGWWPRVPDVDDPDFGAPIDAAQLAHFFDWTLRVHKTVKAERPGLMVAAYGIPPLSYYRVTDNAAQMAQRDKYNDQIAPLLPWCDAICPTFYDFGNDDLWSQSVVLRVQQCRRWGKLVIPYICAYRKADPAAGLLPVKSLTLQIKTLRENADGMVLWGWSPWHSRPHVEAIRAAVN